MLRNLTAMELQELTLMVGSRSGLQTYLGMERKEFETLWKANQLISPTDYLRGQTKDQIFYHLIDKGSIAGAAKHYGVSDSFLKSVVKQFSMIPATTVPLSEALIARYGSVRLTARMSGHSEGRVRLFVKAQKLERLLKYDFSNHNNGKGRRAETHWASLDPENVIEDCNVTQGSQADYDYVHKIHGKVNVKSSAAHRFTAQTRKANPFYWKFSSKSLEKADTVALVLYDSKMQEPLHVFNLKVVPEMLKCGSFRAQVIKKGEITLIYKAD